MLKHHFLREMLHVSWLNPLEPVRVKMWMPPTAFAAGNPGGCPPCPPRMGIRTRGTLYIVDVGVDVDVFFLSLKKLRQLTENSDILAIQC